MLSHGSSILHAALVRLRALRLGLIATILLATLLSAALPLILLSYSAGQALDDASAKARAVASNGLDDQAKTTLESQAVDIATQESLLLQGAVQDTLSATGLVQTPQAFLSFYRALTEPITYPTGTRKAPSSVTVTIPLYRELAYVDAGGQERLVVRDGKVIARSQLRDVSKPQHTAFGHETYFADARALPAGRVSVSPVTAWYATDPRQPAGAVSRDAQAPAGAWLGSYAGIVRFATPLYDGHGRFGGIVELALDVRHLIDRVVHVIPGQPAGTTVWPDYYSGNYPMIWDDQGWLIAHPLLPHLRGLTAAGLIPPPWQQGMNAADFPFNMYRSKLNDQYVAMYRATLRGSVGACITASSAHQSKAEAYAPIRFSTGSDGAPRIFGGVGLGANLAAFHQAATLTQQAIASQTRQLQGRSRFIAAGAFGFLVLLAGLVATNIARPLVRLSEAARAVGRGDTDTATLAAIERRWLPAEVTDLARVFKQMATQVHARESDLRRQVVDLRIQIDKQKQDQEVTEIADSAWFQHLQANAQGMRDRFKSTTPEMPAGTDLDAP